MDVSISFTMDCENLHELSGVGGVTDWDFSERSIRGFAELLESNGHLATLFLCPETAAAHRSWLPELESRGHELALHFHPDSFSDGNAKGLGQLGLYPGDVQQSMLTQGIRVWADALGKAPVCFRPGCLSANDETFGILIDLGLKWGSVSSPGRNEPSLGAIWQPPLLDVHRAHRSLRSLSGDLDFIEVPLTVDWEVRFPHRFGWDLPQELMIERGDVETLSGVVLKNVQRMKANPPQVPSIVVATHNVWDYSDALDEKTEILNGLLDGLSPIENETGTKFVQSTIASAASRF